jgi:glutathione reductase (NADPH)
MRLEDFGIELEPIGAVKVDDYQNTSVLVVYAIGDVTNNIMLTPVAVKTGRIVAERIFGDRPDLKMSFHNIATVIFSHPPTGMVGLTENQAKAKYGEHNVEIYRSKFVNLFYALATDDSKKMGSLFKLICHKED